MKRLLIVDADPACRRTAAALLMDSYRIVECGSASEALALMKVEAPDLVMLDLASGCLDGVRDAVARVAGHASAPGLVCTGPAASTDAIVHAVKRGAHAFAQKPYLPDQLRRALGMAAAERYVRARTAAERPSGWYAREDEDEPDEADDPPEELPDVSSIPLLGRGRAIAEARYRIAQFATNDVSVMILGETGTGKEVAAKAIHDLSRRSRGAFVPVDCASMPEHLAEAELFGTARGAFTGAVQHMGLFEAAADGILFLDEIGELPLSLQGKLLRALESRAGMRVGSVDVHHYDVRVLSATNARVYEDPRRFRTELLNRINTLVLTMPPLRAYAEDIPAIAEAFLERENPEKRFETSALDKLSGWKWPGNVRELKNTVVRASVLSGKRKSVGSRFVELMPVPAWDECQRRLF